MILSYAKVLLWMLTTSSLVLQKAGSARMCSAPYYLLSTGVERALECLSSLRATETRLQSSKRLFGTKLDTRMPISSASQRMYQRWPRTAFLSQLLISNGRLSVTTEERCFPKLMRPAGGCIAGISSKTNLDYDAMMTSMGTDADVMPASSRGACDEVENAASHRTSPRANIGARDHQITDLTVDDAEMWRADASRYGITCFAFRELDSTQKWAERNLSELLRKIPGLGDEEWVCVTADVQTAGVGTRDNALCEKTWSSLSNNLHVTYVIPWPLVKFDALLVVPQVAGLAVLRVLERFGLSGKLKWVNDVVVNNKKIAGILCNNTGVTTESLRCADYQYHEKSRVLLLLGIGVNIGATPKDKICSQYAIGATCVVDEMLNSRHPPPQVSAISHTSFNNEGPSRQISSRRVREMLDRELCLGLSELVREGFGRLRINILSRLMWLNENVQLRMEPHSDPTLHESCNNGSVVERGVLEGIGNDGVLLLRTTDGRLKRFCTGRLLKA